MYTTAKLIREGLRRFLKAFALGISIVGDCAQVTAPLLLQCLLRLLRNGVFKDLVDQNVMALFCHGQNCFVAKQKEQVI